MNLDVQRISKRDKLILTGLFLSKFDSTGLKELGFESFLEAFNVIGYALGAKPASIKNYRDEFDPLFPNRRKGWHKRRIRDYCRKVLEDYVDLDFPTFSALVMSFAGYHDHAWGEPQAEEEKRDSGSFFAKRLVTGLAAEHYFESVHSKLPEFKGYRVENTTRLGCGYDFRFESNSDESFLAVEVKGLREKTGNCSMTSKEYETASQLAGRFILFVVKNFREVPFHEIYRNPLAGDLRFTKKEQVTVSVTWLASV